MRAPRPSTPTTSAGPRPTPSTGPIALAPGRPLTTSILAVLAAALMALAVGAPAARAGDYTVS